MVRLDWDSAGAADFAGVGKGTLSTLMPSQFYSLDRWGSAMHILCPHCRNPIEVVKLNLREEITCPSCGSSLHLETESTTNWQRAAGQNLGKYELLATVGQGAFGTVYKARDPELDRGIAISRGMARPVETEERAPVEIPNRRHPLTSTKPCHARLGHGHSTRLALRRQRRVGSRRPCGRLEESSPAGGRRTESPREGYSGGGGSGTSPPEGSDSSVRSRRHCCGPGRPRLYDAGQLSPPQARRPRRGNALHDRFAPTLPRRAVSMSGQPHDQFPPAPSVAKQAGAAHAEQRHRRRLRHDIHLRRPVCDSDLLGKDQVPR